MIPNSPGESRKPSCHDLLLWKQRKDFLVRTKVISEDEYGTPGAVKVSSKNTLSFLFTSQLKQVHKPTAVEMQVWKEAIQTPSLKVYADRTPSLVKVEHHNAEDMYVFHLGNGAVAVYTKASAFPSTDDLRSWREHVIHSPRFRKLVPTTLQVDNDVRSFRLVPNNLLISISQTMFMINNKDGPIVANKVEFELDDQTCSQAATYECFIDIDSATERGLVHPMRVEINLDFIDPTICRNKSRFKQLWSN